MPERVPWARSLSVRVTVGLVVLATVAVAVLVQVASLLERRHLEALVLRGAVMLGETIRRSTHQTMLQDRRDEAYASMRAIGEQEGIEQVRLVNKEGRITFSTRPGELGTLVDKQAEGCGACHTGSGALVRPDLSSRARIYRTADGHRVLAIMTPLYNEPSCSTAACHVHSPDRAVLGVADVGMSLRVVDEGLLAMRRTSLGVAGVAVVMLGLGLGLFTLQTVVRPVRALALGTHRIAAGDLESRIPVVGSDEIARLAASFNTMTEALQIARQENRALLEGLEEQVEQRTAALKEAQARLLQSEKLASLGRLSASIAHEINNPLAGILVTARLLLRNLEDGSLGEAQKADLVRQLSVVRRETERCTAIVRNLLDFARARPLTMAAVDVRAVVEEALSLVQHQFQLRGMEVVRDLQPVPPVQADFGQLRQAFVNVAINACDAMEAGGRLSVSTRAAEQEAEIVFSDTGAGISEADLGRIFDPFFSTKEKGTGLGLSVVYGIVERHGGRVEASSEVGRGTTFRIRLPRRAGGEGAA